MATPPRSDELKLSVKARIEQKLREGHRPPGRNGHGDGALRAAAKDATDEGEFGSVNAFLSAAYDLRGSEYEPDWTLYRSGRPQQPTPTFMLREAPPPEPSLAVPEGEPEQVLVIPDRHNDPRAPHRLACTTWIARFGAERKPPKVVCLGDAITMDSCSRHDRNETLKGRLKPSIKADLDNHEQSLQAFERARGDWNPVKLKCQGNHEARLWQFENDHPENEGSHTHRYSQDLLQFGWRERPYGEFIYINGVAFTHAPINGMGRPMGGKTATHRAGGMLTSSLVHGHTHQLHVFSDAKMGAMESLTVIQAGCAMPWGEYEAYARSGPGGWWWGVLMLTVWGGQIIDMEAVSMLTLRDRFSDDGADVRAA